MHSPSNVQVIRLAIKHTSTHRCTLVYTGDRDQKDGRTYLCFVYVIIVSLVGTAHDHDDKVLALVWAEVVHGWLQEMLVLCDPLGEVERWCERHVWFNLTMILRIYG